MFHDLVRLGYYWEDLNTRPSFTRHENGLNLILGLKTELRVPIRKREREIDLYI